MKDNFSSRAELYAKFRPRYPKALFDQILSFVMQRELAWDAGTGNGQTAMELSRFFKQVYATDISESQLANATKVANIIYAKEAAERISLDDNSVDLVTISQALHWFDFEKFYNEVRRVSKKDAIIAAWSYNLLKIDDITDKIINWFYVDVLGNYWDVERKYIDEDYRTIPFPFRKIEVVPLMMEFYWTPDQLEGFLNSWSAVQKFISKKNENPVTDVMKKIKVYWHPHHEKRVLFPLNMLMGYVH